MNDKEKLLFDLLKQKDVRYSELIAFLNGYMKVIDDFYRAIEAAKNHF
ncbi:hypothetical protein [Enterococcus gallinarum]|nr:hypothetical protein [Enterococcus gallinarum]MBS7181505.1 hypothetical protein [Enterococcus gallinarum]